MNGAPNAEIQITHAEQLPPAPGQRCAHATGRVDLVHQGQSGQEINSVICTTTPAPMGSYLLIQNYSAVPEALPEREREAARSTTAAIMASFQQNQALIAQQSAALSAPTGTMQTLRGGSFGSDPMSIRASRRLSPEGRMRDWDFGLRCVEE